MPLDESAGTPTFTTVIGVSQVAGAARPHRQAAARPHARRDGVLLAIVAVLVAAAMAVARSGLFTAGSDLGYWIGVAGGIAMLLLFLYPLRKRVRGLRNFGSTRFWFAVHMMLGIGGPLLVIVHSTLRFGSVNAIVAFASMSLVASSGIVGRYLYARIHHGLYGRRASLAELRTQAGLDADAVHSKLAFAPDVAARLAAFGVRADAASREGLANPLRFFALGFVALVERRRSVAEVTRLLRQCGVAEQWSEEKLARRSRGRRALVAAYLRAVQRVAQFGVFERLFSWWHVLHVPLVYMLVLSAIAHVVAVHMY
ncbi:MAG: hypothetical protein ABI886_05820 [Betaproteobacteria bacterium]